MYFCYTTIHSYRYRLWCHSLLNALLKKSPMFSKRLVDFNFTN